jgi:hypothetical protein
MVSNLKQAENTKIMVITDTLTLMERSKSFCRGTRCGIMNGFQI